VKLVGSVAADVRSVDCGEGVVPQPLHAIEEIFLCLRRSGREERRQVLHHASMLSASCVCRLRAHSTKMDKVPRHTRQHRRGALVRRARSPPGGEHEAKNVEKLRSPRRSHSRDKKNN
jgi:hypothetical protein